MAGTKWIAGLLLVCSSALAGPVQYLTWDQDTMIREAVKEAIKLMSKRKHCGEIFGPDAAAVLKSANYKFIPLGRPQPTSRPGAPYAIINALTLRDMNLIVINSNGTFTRPRMTIGAVHFDYGLRDDLRVRSFLLLHELGHLTGNFEPDGNNPDLSKKYSDLVLKGCFN